MMVSQISFRQFLSASSVATLVLLGALWAPGVEAGTEQVYQRPPEVIAKVVEAPFTPTISVSPDHKNILILTRPGLAGIDEVSQPELRIAGLRINPRNYGPSRARYTEKLALRSLEGGDERPIKGLPENPKISMVRWSPNGRHIAFLLTLSETIELWTIEVASAKAGRLFDKSVNHTYSDTLVWAPDGSAVFASVIPDDHGDAPQKPSVPTGPVIQENLGRVAPARTYQDLLKSPHDESVFEHYTTSQIVRAGLDGSLEAIGPAGIIGGFTPSPDGRYILVSTTRKPFSYTVPSWRFPLDIEVWNPDGEVVATIATLPLADDVPVPFGSVRTGPRIVNWRSDADSTLFLVEALDGGDAGADAELRDRLSLLEAPFSGSPRVLAEIDLRYRGTYWGSDDLAYVSGVWFQNRQAKVWRVRPSDPGSAPVLTMDYSYEDRYSDPGRPLLTSTPRGTKVLVTADDGATVFLSGSGASPEGDRPFLDAMNVETGETRRLFHSAAPFYERPVEFLDPENGLILTSRESKDIQPNYWIRNLDADTKKQITAFPHPNPQFADVQKEMVRYTRSDGVELTATLYLPTGYDKEKDGPLPMLMWAYPQEFKSASAAGQVTDSPSSIRQGDLLVAHAVARPRLRRARRPGHADRRRG